MKRSFKGNGTVRQLGCGKWLTKVPVGKTAKGETRYVSRRSNSKSEAIRIQNELINLREQQLLIAGPRQTLRQYATEVLVGGSDRTSDRTRDGYFLSLRTHVFPAIGTRPLIDIKPQELDRLFIEIRKSHSANTVRNVRTALSKVFTAALRHGIVNFNPVSRTEKPKKYELDKTQVQPPWTKEELKKALETAKGTEFEAFLALALATGMRRGELLGLKWTDVDFENMTISIERTMYHQSIIQPDGTTQRSEVVRPPKTASSRRVNQLTPGVVEVLKKRIAVQDSQRIVAGSTWADTDLIFTNRQGGALDGSNFYKRYQRFLKVNGLRHVRIHDLRHTFATVLLNDDKVQHGSISKALGHSSLAITLDIYGKTSKVDTIATTRMSEILFPDAEKVESISVPSVQGVSIAPWMRRSS